MKKTIIYLICVVIFFQSTLSANAGELNQTISQTNQVISETVSEEEGDLKIEESKSEMGEDELGTEGEEDLKTEESESETGEGKSETEGEGELKTEESELETGEDEPETEGEEALKTEESESETEGEQTVNGKEYDTVTDAEGNNGTAIDDDPLYGRENGYTDVDFYGLQTMSVDEEYIHNVQFLSGNYKIHKVIDVSKYQKDIDWVKVKQSGVDYAIIRAGFRGYGDIGTLNTDSYFKQNIEGALAAGIEVGVYFFSQAITEIEATEEAKYVLDLIEEYEISLPVAIDFEYAYDKSGVTGRLYSADLSKEAATQICKKFCTAVEDKGYTAMVYANRSMLENGLDASEIAENYKIWLAHYTDCTDYAGDYEFWQYTQSGTVDGITTNVDLNFWYKAQEVEYSEVSDGIYVIHSALDKTKVLDVSGGSKYSGANIQLYTANGTSAQQFAVKHLADGKYNIYSYQSGMAVTVKDGKNINGANVFQFYPLAEKSQTWSIVPTGKGDYEIISTIGDKALDVSGAKTDDGTNIQIYESNRSQAQRFYFEKIRDIDSSEFVEEELEDGTYIICSSINENKVLDVDGGSTNSNANIQLYTSNNTTAQEFVIQKDKDTGFYTIASKKSGMRMTYSEGVLKNFSNVYQDDVGVQWEFRHIIGEYYMIYVANSSYCLDVDGGQAIDRTNIHIYQANETTAQIFRLKKINSQTTTNLTLLEEGIYLIHTGKDDKKVIDVANGSTSNQANIQIYEKNGTTAQLFAVKKIKNGGYSIYSYQSNLAMTVENGRNSDGVNVYQYFPNNSDSQKWRIIPDENGYYKIISAIGNKALDVKGGETSNGTNIQIYSDNGSMSQRFRFKKVGELEEWIADEKKVEEGTYIISSALDASKVLDVDNGSLMIGANIQIYSSNNTIAQQFVIEKANDTEFYTITSKNAGMRITYVDGKLSNSINVYQYASTDTVGNQWRLENIVGDYYKIYAENSLYCLEVANGSAFNGTNIQIYSDNGSTAQIFKLQKVSNQTTVNQNAAEEIENGIYTIQTSLKNSMVLDVTSGSTQNGANIQIYESNETPAQQYEFKKLENGNYTITARNSRKMLTIKQGDFSNGSNVYQDDAKSLINQQWKIISAGKGEYIFVSAQSGKALDVAGAKTVNGTNIQVYQSNLTEAQRFKIIPVAENITASFSSLGGSVVEFEFAVRLKGNSHSSDNNYYLIQVENYTNNIIEEPFAQIEKGIEISFSSSDFERSRLKELLMHKVALAVKLGDGSYQQITKAVNISNPQAIASNIDAIFKGTSKKGLQGIYYATYDGGNDILEARNANTKQTLINLDLASVVTTNPNKAGYKPYTYKGNTYYFSELSALKANIRSLNIGYKQYLNGNSGTTPVAVTLCLLLSYNSENSFLIDPAARTPGRAYYTLNVREEYARETLEALFFYLGETFGQSDCYVSNWILGNEINSSKAWNYSGSLDFDTYMDCYATAFRMLYIGVKSEKTGNTVSISLDNGWTAVPDTYAGKTTLDTFAKKIHAQNPNIDWSIAYHPYSYPLTRVDFWNDYKNTTDSLSTPYISMRNINVLTNYAGTLESTYGKKAGSIRVLLTEQGYSYSGGAENQAMAIARGYYMAEFNDRIDAFIIRAVVDDADEASGKLYFGLMNSQHEKRIAFYVYEFMDSSRSGFASQSSSIVSDENRSKFEAAKSIVCNTNWSSIVPGFDDSKLAAIK